MRSDRLVLAGVLLLTVLVYAQTVAAPFVYEDGHWLQTAALEWGVPSRALTLWTFQFTGTPDRAHLVSLGLHVVNGALLYAVAERLAGSTAALFAAVLCLLHPLNSEAVAYVGARGDLLLTTGLLLATLAALTLQTWRGIALLAAGVAVAAMSKELGLIAVPLALLTLAVWRSRLPLVAPALLGAAALVVAVQYPRIVGWADMAPTAGGSTFAWSTYAWLQWTQVCRLLALVVWPVGFTLDHDVAAYGPLWAAVAGIGMLTAVAVALMAWLGRARLLGWTLAWMAIALAPRLLFRTNEWVHEYQTYPAMVGLCIGLGALLALAYAWIQRREATA